MDIKNADHVEIYEAGTNGTNGNPAGLNGLPGGIRFHGRNTRDTAHTSLESYLKKHPDATYSGHPDNFMKVISRVVPKPGEFRSLSAIEVEGGGLLLQSSWREEGLAPSGQLVYARELCLKKKEYTDPSDGETKVGFVLAKREAE